MIYRIVVDFETREEAEACLEVLASWEASELAIENVPANPMGISDSGFIDPPENPFAVHSIEEVEVSSVYDTEGGDDELTGVPF
jgi:hypothetical protein